MIGESDRKKFPRQRSWIKEKKLRIRNPRMVERVSQIVQIAEIIVCLLKGLVMKALIQGLMVAVTVLTFACKPPSQTQDSDAASALNDKTGAVLFSLLAEQSGNRQYCAYERDKLGKIRSLNTKAWSVSTSHFNASLREALRTAGLVGSGIGGALLAAPAYAGCVGAATAGSVGTLTLPSLAGCLGVMAAVQTSVLFGGASLISKLADADKPKRLATYYGIMYTDFQQTFTQAEYNMMKKELTSSGNSDAACPSISEAEKTYRRKFN